MSISFAKSVKKLFIASGFRARVIALSLSRVKINQSLSVSALISQKRDPNLIVKGAFLISLFSRVSRGIASSWVMLGAVATALMVMGLASKFLRRWSSWFRALSKS